MGEINNNACQPVALTYINNKTLSEANASLFFVHKVSVLGGAIMSF